MLHQQLTGLAVPYCLQIRHISLVYPQNYSTKITFTSKIWQAMKLLALKNSAEVIPVLFQIINTR